MATRALISTSLGAPVGTVTRVLLVRPPEEYRDISFQDLTKICRVNIPLSLLLLGKACTKQGGVDVQVLDAVVHAKLPSFREFQARRQEFVWGTPAASMFDGLAPDYVPDVIAITAMFSHVFPSVVKTAFEARKRFPNALIVLGGADATAMYREYLQQIPEIDLIGLGEGEQTFTRLISMVRRREDWHALDGIAFRQGDKVVNRPTPPMIQNLDDYEPDYELIDLEDYFEANRRNFPPRVSFEYPESHRAMSFITSRGCPYKCTFCSIHVHMGKAFREHSPEFVVNQLADLAFNRGVKHIHFEDDNLTFDLDRFKRICRMMIDRKLNITWDTPNGVRADMLDEELFAMLKESGCVYLVVGIESGVQRVVYKIIKKGLRLDRAVSSLQRCAEIGIDSGAFYMIGFPGEKRDDIQHTLKMALELFLRYKTRPHLNIVRAYPGTALYDEVMRKKLVLETSGANEVIPSLVLKQAISCEEFDANYLRAMYRRFQLGFIAISGLHFLVAALRTPLISLRRFGDLLKSIARDPREYRLALSRFYLGAVLFPYSWTRVDLRR